MKQHPIPQNILDVEFKLFTKFTVREFVYLATGVGFGGIFIYLFTTQAIPAIIAFPIFLISSLMGIFLGLVKINDQSADIFVRNFITAITKPTQRVWKNEFIDERVEELTKPDLNIPTKIQRGQNMPENVRVFGMDNQIARNQFIEESKLAELDMEEKQKMDSIGQDTSSIQTNDTIPQQKASQKPINTIMIAKQNAIKFQTEFTANPIGNINIKVVDKDNKSIVGAILIIKDFKGRVISALQTNQNGETSLGKVLPSSVYDLDIQKMGYIFPKVQLLIEDMLPPIKITAV